MKLRVLFLGSPGVGKGTQAYHLSKRYNIPEISSGNMLRESIKEGGKIAEEIKKYIHEGVLVPDEIVITMIKEKIKKNCSNGFVLEGFPRNIKQAYELDKMLEELNFTLNIVINLEISDNFLIKRLSGRKVCQKCGAVFNFYFYPSKIENICDYCQNELFQRKDDKPEVIKKRLEIYKETILPLIQYYTEKDIVVNIRAEDNVQNIFQEIIKVIEKVL